MLQKIFSLKKEDWLRGLCPDEYYDGGNVLYVAKGIDLFRTPGRLAAGIGATVIGSGTVVDSIKWFKVRPSGSYGYGYGSGGRIYQIALSGDDVTIIDTNTDSQGQGLEIYNGNLLFSKNTRVSIYNWSTFNDTNVGGAGTLTTSLYHPMKVGVDNNCYVGNVNKLAKWDGGTFTSDKLTFNSTYIITALENDGFYLVIGATSDPVTGGTNRVATILFWDMVSAQANRVYNLPEAEDINYLLYKDGWIYVFCSNVIYRCQFDVPPQEYLRRTGMLFGRSQGKTADVRKGVMIWSDNTGVVGSYGSAGYKLPEILQTPYKVPTGVNENISSLMYYVPLNVLYVATSTPKLYIIYTGTATAGLSAQTPYIDLGRYWKLHYLKIITDTLASGDSLTLSLKSVSGGTELLDATTFTYSADGAKKTKNLPISGKITDQFQLTITFTAGAVKVKEVQLFGEPMSELYSE